MDSILERIKNEPVLLLAVVESILALVVAFGLDLTGEQVGSIMAVSAALVGLVARTQVTPTRKL